MRTDPCFPSDAPAAAEYNCYLGTRLGASSEAEMTRAMHGGLPSALTFACGLASLFFAPPPAHAQTASVSAWEAAQFRSWSFIPNWTSQSQINSFATDRVYDHLSDVLYSFGVQPKADGSLYYHPASSGHLATLKNDQAEFGFRYHMCMYTVNGGATDAVWETITSTPSIRATFVNNVKNLLAANNMTGMNLDWERPNSVAEWGNYTQLAKDMQAAFPASWEVSVDDYGSADSRWNDSPLFSASAFDQVGLMAYHYNAAGQNTWANSHTALGFSNSQLILGMGTWGDDGPATVSLKSIVAANPNLPADATNFTGTVNDINGVSRTGTWDIVSRYEVRDNVQLALNRGMAGVMWWTLSYDATNKMSLARVAHHYAMVKRNVPDLNLDGKVNAADAHALADNMGTLTDLTGTTTQAQFEDFYQKGNWEKGDRDGNRYVNQADADWLAGRYAALGVALPDRLAFTGSFEKLSNAKGLAGRWQAARGPGNQLIETGNFTQQNDGFLPFSAIGPGADTYSNSFVTIRNQNSTEAAGAVNAQPRSMRSTLATPVDLGEHGDTYITFLVRQNTAPLSASQLASPNRLLSLEMLDAAGANQFDFTFLGQQTDFSIRSQADAAGDDVIADGFAGNLTYLFIGKISGNGADANTIQAKVISSAQYVPNFTDPAFEWTLTAQSSADFNPVITQMQITSQHEANYTISNVWIGSESQFFAPPTPGDFNADSTIDDVDFGTWAAGLGMTEGATHWHGDANGDGMVDGFDFLAWQQNMGAPAIAAIPEPATLGLSMLAAVLAALQRGRRCSR